ncbi:hypothetical protein PhCBS80983_g00447 [Powellomyces hirtus]|uniref:Peroxisomal membrane protein PEX14 n=1 Tax=Powellomyces hirtus TaxID=109895 RepID=A0A507EEP2_9FUNG|nr:hypothetical protein PhCBS80983_g00447 [Powellomyces hirtus]
MVKPGVREDIVLSAVRFLQDAKVQESPLAKRVAFLESKGLTADEIEEAMSRVNNSNSSGTTSTSTTASTVAAPQQPYQMGHQMQMYPQHYPQYPPPPPPVMPYTWKDYTLGAVGAVGAGYGVYTLAKKYLLPLLSFPTSTSLDASTQQLSSQLASTTTVLDAVRAETTDVMKAMDTQAENVGAALKGMVDTLAQIRENEEQRDEEMLNLKRDIDSIKSMIPQMLDKNKESQTAVISDLQTEIKSLKNLLLNRRLPMSSPSPSTSSLPAINDPNGPDTSSPASASDSAAALPAAATSSSSSSSSSGPPSFTSRTGSFANIPTKPTIPAWQLAAQKQQQNAATPAPDTTNASSPTDSGKTPSVKSDE